MLAEFRVQSSQNSEVRALATAAATDFAPAVAGAFTATLAAATLAAATLAAALPTPLALAAAAAFAPAVAGAFTATLAAATLAAALPTRCGATTAAALRLCGHSFPADGGRSLQRRRGFRHCDVRPHLQLGRLSSHKHERALLTLGPLQRRHIRLGHVQRHEHGLHV